MRVRDHDIVRLEAQSSDASSKTWDLKYKNPLSSIWIEGWATNGTTSNKGNFISDIITKVEVVDGSKPLASLNFKELEYLNFLKTRQSPGIFASGWASGTQRHGAMLMFGRYPLDQEYAFDCSRYSNPQLKITWNLAAVRAVSATTAFATGTLKLTACAKVMEDIPMPGKFLSARQVSTFTMPTSGSKNVRMYRDYPWRLALIRSYLDGYDIDEMIETLSIDCDAGQFKPLDKRYMRDLDSEALQMFGRHTLKHDLLTSDNEANVILTNKEPDCRAWDARGSAPDILGIIYQWSSQLKLAMIDNAAAQDTTDRQVTMVEEGHALNAIVPIVFGRLDEPKSWLDATKFGQIDLDLFVASGGGYAGVSSVLLEQERPNGS